MSQWEISSKYHLNTTLVKEQGLELLTPDLNEWNPDNETIIARGSYRACLKMASHLKWEWESANGYKAIYTERDNRYHRSGITSKLNRITYIVMAHFGMPAYVLCTVRRIEE